MEHIQSERDGNLSILTLSRGKANALNFALVEELCGAVAAAAADDSVRGLVLASNRPRFFSSGFDIREVFGYDREGMSAFFGRFIDLYEGLYHCPKPVVAALSGHTFAGGAILAIACDFRIMAEGDFGFAMNEINLGLALSPTMRSMLMNAAGLVPAREIMLFGEPLTPARALEIGLVRELAPAEQVRDRAVSCARALAAKPPAAYRAMKQSLQELGARPDLSSDICSDRTTLDQFLDTWFSAEAQEARRAVASKF